MMNERVTGRQKAAIFLLGIGEEMASEIVKNLDEEEIKRLGTSMSRIASLNSKAVETIFSEFHDLASANQLVPIGHSGGAKFVKTVLSKALEQDKARTIYKEIEEEGKWNLFQKIRRLDPKTISNFIRNEHPQTISIILAHLDPSQTAAIMGELPGPLQAEIIFRIAELETVSPTIIEEVDQAMQAELEMLNSYEGQHKGGVRSVAEILNQMESSAESAIFRALEEQKQGLADEIRQLMFVFEDLIQLDDRAVMAVLKEVSNETLILAMKTASDEMKEKVFKNMSERAAQMMKEDLEVMGPVRLKDVETAQQGIIQVAKKLESEGKIVLMGKGKEDVLV